jgi:putative hydrolase of the HAD superfamily
MHEGMTAMNVLIWDFDGTLAYREGGGFGASLIEAIMEVAPDWPGKGEALRPYLQTGFPWHTPEQSHTHIRTSDQWWGMLYPVFEHALAAAGFDGERGHVMARRVRAVYTDPTRWCLFPDVLPVLEHLRADGWTHHVLSNHVPELPQIVHHLGLTPYVAGVHTSAAIGYEKPHAEAFRHVTKALPLGTAAWMIGDSMEADIQGAESVGLKAILVRRPSTQATRYSKTLAGIAAIVAGSQETLSTGEEFETLAGAAG